MKVFKCYACTEDEEDCCIVTLPKMGESDNPPTDCVYGEQNYTAKWEEE